MVKLPELTDQQLASLAEFYAGEGGWQNEDALDLLDLGVIEYEEHCDGYEMWVTTLGEEVMEANRARLPR